MVSAWEEHHTVIAGFRAERDVSYTMHLAEPGVHMTSRPSGEHPGRAIVDNITMPNLEYNIVVSTINLVNLPNNVMITVAIY